MKIIVYISALITIMVCFSCQSKASPETSSSISEEDEKLLRHIKEKDWPKAYREQDILLLDRILGRDFQMIDQNGNWYTKADEISWIKANKTQYDSFRYEIKRLDVLPNGTALICGTGHIYNDTVKTIYQSSNIFIKRKGNWKAVASHVSGIKNSNALAPYSSFGIPGDTPKIFAPDFISKVNRWEGNVNFNRSGTAIFFNVFTDSLKTIYSSAFDGNQWSEPLPMPQLKDQNTWEPFISWDEKQLYFVSDLPPGSPEWDGRIWFMEKMPDNRWSAPKHFEMAVEPKLGLWFPNTTNQGMLYFCAALKNRDSVGMGDMYRMDLKTKEIRLLRELCSANEDWDPFVAPDGSYIMWASDRVGGYGGTDLYISFKDANDRWKTPINLGPKINTQVYEVAPRITPDGRFLFFDRPIKGTQDAYWVSTDFLQELKHKEPSPSD